MDVVMSETRNVKRRCGALGKLAGVASAAAHISQNMSGERHECRRQQAEPAPFPAENLRGPARCPALASRPVLPPHFRGFRAPSPPHW
eukprot:scaffold93455_cov36-Tisochrysis_lutea.AAC.2